MPNEYFERMKRPAKRQVEAGDNDGGGVMMVYSNVASLKRKEGRGGGKTGE